MRIVAGRWKGRHLNGRVPEGTRPTSDRARESLFNVLRHRFDVDFEGKKILDLYAGTGALGFEALSRGASFCTFIDQDVDARGLIRDHAEALQAVGVCRIFRRDASCLGEFSESKPYDLVFLDPPYGQGLIVPTLQQLILHRWIADDGLVVVEDEAASSFAVPAGFEAVHALDVGAAKFVFLKVARP